MLYAFFCKITDRLKNNPSPLTPHPSPPPPIKVGVVNLIKGETKIFNITELKNIENRLYHRPIMG